MTISLENKFDANKLVSAVCYQGIISVRVNPDILSDGPKTVEISGDAVRLLFPSAEEAAELTEKIQSHNPDIFVNYEMTSGVDDVIVTLTKAPREARK